MVKALTAVFGGQPDSNLLAEKLAQPGGKMEASPCPSFPSTPVSSQSVSALGKAHFGPWGGHRGDTDAAGNTGWALEP